MESKQVPPQRPWYRDPPLATWIIGFPTTLILLMLWASLSNRGDRRATGNAPPLEHPSRKLVADYQCGTARLQLWGDSRADYTTVQGTTTVSWFVDADGVYHIGSMTGVPATDGFTLNILPHTSYNPELELGCLIRR